MGDFQDSDIYSGIQIVVLALFLQALRSVRCCYMLLHRFFLLCAEFGKLEQLV